MPTAWLSRSVSCCQNCPSPDWVYWRYASMPSSFVCSEVMRLYASSLTDDPMPRVWVAPPCAGLIGHASPGECAYRRSPAGAARVLGAAAAAVRLTTLVD